LLRAAHWVFRRKTASHHDYLRYSWTASNEKIKQLGFEPRSSTEALAEFLQKPLTNNAGSKPFDDFGIDKQYIDFYGRTLFYFLADWYWRIEVAGIDHIPSQGRGILTGIHRGFMPWDGVMALHLTVRGTGRYPRFLIHPGLVKFPFLANFMTKLGGIIACQQNAAHVLERDELLGVFPEGIHGAFVHYSQAYKIGDFHRDYFVKIALRHRAPIIPFVTVGSAEIFPILAKLKARWWTRYTEWPSFPITPTFPLIPLPLPSKWHTRFLSPMHVEEDYPPSAATNTRIVRSISNEIRHRMQQAIDEMLQRRHSIFFGSIFPANAK
jgi:1-acyl-sn-glycerol-3-phosphate acyltransferase